MEKATLEKLIRAYEGDDLAKYVCEVIESDKWLRNKVALIRKEQEQEDRKHKAALAHIRKEWEELRRECPHHESTFHADPSGGNDSETTCDICGAGL